MKGCRALTQIEIEMVRDVLDLRGKCLFILGIKTGFRISELLSIDIEDVNGGVVRLRKQNTKGKVEGRTVPIHDEAQQWLDAYIGSRKTGPVFITKSGRRWARNEAHVTLKNAYDKAKVIGGNLATHSMRKSFCKNFFEACNRDLLLTQVAMRHKSPSSTISYLSVDQDKVDEIMRKLK